MFLIKTFKKYSAAPAKKINQIKLSRLNGFFYKIYKNPPEEIEDIKIVYQIILLFLHT